MPKTNKVEKPVVKRPYALWKVGGKDYMLVLKTAGVCEAETKLKGKNLIEFMGSEEGLPGVGAMLIITHCAMLMNHHGIDLNDVYDLYDQYIDEGGTMMDFYLDIFMEIYKVSGFLSKAQSKSLNALMGNI